MMNASIATNTYALTGEDVLTKMEKDAQVDFVSGILEGLGYARFLADQTDTDGLKCVSNWLIDGGVKRWKIAEQWLSHHKEKQVSAIIYAMVSKDCGR